MFFHSSLPSIRNYHLHRDIAAILVKGDVLELRRKHASEIAQLLRLRLLFGLVCCLCFFFFDFLGLLGVKWFTSACIRENIANAGGGGVNIPITYLSHLVPSLASPPRLP